LLHQPQQFMITVLAVAALWLGLALIASLLDVSTSETDLADRPAGSCKRVLS
jgi:hypothetical protein